MINPDELNKLITCDGVGKQAKQEIVDRVIKENAALTKALADWQACAKSVDRKMLHEQQDHNKTVDKLIKWKACASYLARQLKIADAKNGNYNYQLSPQGGQASEQALKTFEELSG